MAPSASSSYRFKLNKTKLLVVVYVSIAVNVFIHLRQFYQPMTEETLKNSNNYYHHGFGMIPIPKEEAIFLSNNNDKDLPPPICTSRTIQFPVYPSVNGKQDTTDKEKMKQMAKKNPSMSHSHSNSVLLSPGEKGELVWKFSNKAIIEAACNVPGHYEVGMIAKINEI